MRPQPKPPSVASDRRADRKHQREVIASVRRDLWARETHCALCLRAFAGSEGEMHEIIPRSATRGQPPEERFNLRNCVRLHRACHQQTSRLRLHGLIKTPERG